VNLSRIDQKSSRFEFFESEMLPRDLRRLLQAPDPDLLARNLVAQIAASTTESFPGTILLYDGRPCAAIGCTREPRGTVAVSEPIVLLNATDEVYQAICGQLLNHIKRRAAAAGAERLHFLQSNSSRSAKFASLLVQQSFVHVTDIIQWERFEAARRRFSPPDQCEFRLFDFTANEADNFCEVRRALDAILECSEDLKNQPSPNADELLARWEQMRVRVFVCRFGESIAGMMSCASQSFRSSAVEPTLISTESNTCIEYIGVVPEFRQKKIATLMIEYILTLSNPGGDTSANRLESQGIRISAYSDSANSPARSLYHRCEFMQTARMPLWCCDLNHVDLQQK
jgi:GNAT superfamily N-acetyltransferase